MENSKKPDENEAPSATDSCGKPGDPVLTDVDKLKLAQLSNELYPPLSTSDSELGGELDEYGDPVDA